MDLNDRSILDIAVVAIIVIAAFAAVMMGDGGEDKEVLSMSGSTTVFPIADACAAEYMDQNDSVAIIISGGGSGTGVNEVGQGITDIGMASRDIKSSEQAQYPGLVVHAIAKDGVAIITHDDVDVTVLTMVQIEGIYNGTYANWAQLGGADLEIVPFAREDGSGTRDTFDDAAMGDSEYSDDVRLDNSNGGIKTSVVNTAGAIGYLGLGYVDDSVDAMSIDIDGSIVAPSVDNVVSGAYPIARTLYMITDGPASGATLAFIDFILSPVGQSIVQNEGFIPVSLG